MTTHPSYTSLTQAGSLVLKTEMKVGMVPTQGKFMRGEQTNVPWIPCSNSVGWSVGSFQQPEPKEVIVLRIILTLVSNSKEQFRFSGTVGLQCDVQENVRVRVMIPPLLADWDVYYL